MLRTEQIADCFARRHLVVLLLLPPSKLVAPLTSIRGGYATSVLHDRFYVRDKAWLTAKIIFHFLLISACIALTRFRPFSLSLFLPLFLSLRSVCSTRGRNFRDYPGIAYIYICTCICTCIYVYMNTYLCKKSSANILVQQCRHARVVFIFYFLPFLSSLHQSNFVHYITTAPSICFSLLVIPLKIRQQPLLSTPSLPFLLPLLLLAPPSSTLTVVVLSYLIGIFCLTKSRSGSSAGLYRIYAR